MHLIALERKGGALPQNYSYPGVYVEEIPSEVRTIVGVPTSIVAFIGHAKAGPILEPTTIFSFEEFRDQFGGVWPESSLGYAVRDFYLNAPGGQAIIVRVPVSPTEAEGEGGEGEPARAEEELATIDLGVLELEARSPGAWGNELTAVVDRDNLILPNGEDIASTKLFNLTVTRTEPGRAPVVERFPNVSTDPFSPRRVDVMLESTSNLVRVHQPVPGPDGEPPVDPFAAASPRVEAATASGTGGEDVSGTPTRADYAAALESLAKVDIFNLLAILPPSPPGEDDPLLDAGLIDLAMSVAQQRRAMLILDPPVTWRTPRDVLEALEAGEMGSPSPYAALYFPRIRRPEPTLSENDDDEFDFAPSGAIAGVFSRTDAERGVWKAPAGLDAMLLGAPKLSVDLSDQENGLINPRGVNALRVKPGPARVVWGARTRAGDDQLASQWKYIPIRRLANFIEESLYRGIQWVVFEPNDEPLWAAIRLNVGAFMQSLFRQGAFQGGTPREAYFVKCDEHTTTQDDINRGIVNIIVGFAPLKPAEFVVLKLQQIAGQIET